MGLLMSLLLAPDVVRDWGSVRPRQYCDDVNDICHCLESRWTVEVDAANGCAHSIIHSSAENVSTYHRNIDVRWEPGVKPKPRS